jgi:hypothetical protein
MRNKFKNKRIYITKHTEERAEPLSFLLECPENIVYRNNTKIVEILHIYD